jgi:hypothetical protein
MLKGETSFPNKLNKLRPQLKSINCHEANSYLLLCARRTGNSFSAKKVGRFVRQSRFMIEDFFCQGPKNGVLLNLLKKKTVWSYEFIKCAHRFIIHVLINYLITAVI